MERIETEGILFYDGSYWIFQAVRRYNGRWYYARHTFGREPGSAEMLQFYREGWGELRFFPGPPGDARFMKPASYKRKIRAAKKSMKASPKATARDLYKEALKLDLLRRDRQATIEKAQKARDDYRRRREKKKRRKRGR